MSWVDEGSQALATRGGGAGGRGGVRSSSPSRGSGKVPKKDLEQRCPEPGRGRRVRMQGGRGACWGALGAGAGPGRGAVPQGGEGAWTGVELQEALVWLIVLRKPVGTPECGTRVPSLVCPHVTTSALPIPSAAPGPPCGPDRLMAAGSRGSNRVPSEPGDLFVLAEDPRTPRPWVSLPPSQPQPQPGAFLRDSRETCPSSDR